MSVTTETNRRGARRDRSLARLQRDAALMRVGRMRRLLIGGVAGLTAALAYFVSAIAPGRTLPSSKRAAAVPSSNVTTASATMPQLASPAQLGLQSPNQAPQSAPAQSHQSQAAATPTPAPAGSASAGSASAGSAPAGTAPAGTAPPAAAADNPPAATTGGS